MINLVVATRNVHKVREIAEIIGSGFRCAALADFPNAPQLIEDGDTFSANATRKAVQLAEWLARRRNSELEARNPIYVLADDSGLEVGVLNGAPGVHSARFAAGGGNASGNSADEDNNAELLCVLKGVPAERRAARFRCVLALTPVHPTAKEPSSPVCYANELELLTELFEGVCEGRIALEPVGKGGFGYDPLFVPMGHEQTFGELSEDIKNSLSHRAKALSKLRERLSKAAQGGPA
jgi:XTP/dITP diphosphohydrolase